MPHIKGHPQVVSAIVKTSNDTIIMHHVLLMTFIAVTIEVRVLNVLGILLGHWVYVQVYAPTQPPISPADPLIGLVLLAALISGGILYRKYRSLALGVFISAPITWVLVAWHF